MLDLILNANVCSLQALVNGIVYHLLHSATHLSSKSLVTMVKIIYFANFFITVLTVFLDYEFFFYIFTFII